MVRPIEIKEKKLLLVEGVDAYNFAIWAYQGFGASGIQVLNFGGIKELKPYLEALVLYPGYENVETLVVARDAENDSKAAIQSVQDALRNINLSAPDKPFEFAGNSPRTAFMIFPGLPDIANSQSLVSGTLEDLCLEIVKDEPSIECVDQFIDCLKLNGQPLKYPHKTKLHTYLSANNKFVGLKIGEAARVGAWNWEHSALEPFRHIISSM